MADAAELRIAVIADATKASKELSNVEGSVGKLSGAVKGVAAGLAGAFVVDKVIDFTKQAVTAADEAAKVGAKTEAIIKATGAAAGLTADQVGALAESISLKTAVDDEAIQTGANMLLTFKAVKNEAGKGADVFNRATAAAVDLSSAGFGSIESASVMLGKALQDPEKGMTSLARAGVTFTEQQKEQVTALVASNDILGAQKIILGEVEGQVKGTAEASASSMDKMKLAFGNALEKIGAAILPVVEQLLPVFLQLLDALLPVVLPIVTSLADMARTVLAQLIPALQPLLIVIGTLGQALAQGLGDILIALAPTLVALVPPLVQILQAMMPLIPLTARLFVAIAPLVTIVAELAAIVVTLASHLVGPLLSALEKVLGPIEKLSKLAGKVGGAIGSLNPFGATAGMVYALPAGRAAGNLALPAGRAVPRSITINVQSPLGSDPYRMGSAIVSALKRYEGRMGSVQA